jgi:bifunctional non-homologous end joining protein LigD
LPRDAVRAGLPDVAPELATPATGPPAGPDWIHEIKFDGYRLLCRIEHGAVRLVSRNGKDWSDRFASVVAAAASLPVQSAILDGEVAIVLPTGRTSFQHLQNYLGGESSSEGTLRFFAFDLLFLDDTDWMSRPLVERKARLSRLLSDVSGPGPFQYCDHVEGNGGPFFKAACKHGLEGIVSKRRNSPYRPGRGRDWLKIKCQRVDEFVVGGFTEPAGSRHGLGALLIGGHDRDGNLRFAGRVGTGFTDAQLVSISRTLLSLERPDSPFLDGPEGRAARGMHWVDPTLVAQVAFTELTNESILRHPSFRGFREDKPAADVMHPAWVEPDNASEPDSAPRVHSSAIRRKMKKKGSAEVAGIAISNPDKILYPRDGITKLELARHYEAVAPFMVQCVTGRPLTLVRCPNGIDDCFYQKHMEGTVPDSVRKVPVAEGGQISDYAEVDSAAGLVALAQLGVLEIHTWGSTTRDLERPDKFTMDFDPDPDVPWIRVVEAVLEMRGFLGELGLESFLKTTGGKGLHVVTPIEPEMEWDALKEFTRQIAAAVARDNPGRYTLSISKEKRKGRILIDYLRNGRGATAIEAWSTRARTGGTVAVPIRWEELADDVRSDQFTIRNIPGRLEAMGSDPWKDFARARTAVTAAARRSLGLP